MPTDPTPANGMRESDHSRGVSTLKITSKRHARAPRALLAITLGASLALAAGLALATTAASARCAIRPRTSCPGALLNNRHLHGAHLKGANLQGAHMVHADLHGADLRGANLSNANLSNANLQGARLQSAILSGANLRGANLSGANLSRANLSHANLRGAHVPRVRLGRAILIGVTSGKITGRPAALPAGWVLYRGRLTFRPVLSRIAAGPSSAFVITVSWMTDQPSDSQVKYGTTTAYRSRSKLVKSLVRIHSQRLVGLRPNVVYHYRVTSRNAAGQRTTSGDFTFITPAVRVPLIIDTDIFSNADDVGALASAFALQLNGEAHVVATILNTRKGQPVETNSWQCAAAIAQFYGSSGTLLGSDTPNNGTATNAPHDFIGPCASEGTPVSAPPPAVTVYRRALASQPDGSVVIDSGGYFENLSALLNSSPDTFSPLSGRDLVARKVRMLVAMAGHYPSGIPETNLAGNPAAAQNVAAHWPTKIVWSGYEVGILVHAGSTISATHPTTSPVRAAYEAFVGPDKWIPSFDLTSVYHAIRPWDPALTEVGPGTNVVTPTGGNTFTMGAGNQYYLHLTNVSGLDRSLESLLDTLP